MAALSGLGFLLQDTLAPDDVVMICTSTRGLLGNIGLAGGAAHAGAMVIPSGVIDPAQALAQLAAPLCIPGKKSKASTLAAYPSYVGMLVEEGLRRGYRPHDFGLERILGGGEIVTQGLKDRARRVFGDTCWIESWAMTETYPVGGTRCEEGHLHFPLDQGLVEALDPDSGERAEPGETGVLVVTPFAPFRDATPLLRYNTEDLVLAVPAALTCSLKSLPATSDLLGKQRLSVRVDGQWVTPRQVLEALEALECVPLPARCGFRLAPGRVAVDVEVVVREEGAQVRHAVIAALEARAVPVRDVRLVIDPGQLEDPYPLRGDLRETHFTATPSLQSRTPGNAG
jgi:phenylacetate-coenzyme A ligase PaaK-like adenylate-forming protein